MGRCPARVWEAAARAEVRLVWAFAGVPSGFLGWVFARTASLSSGPLYAAMGEASELGPGDELLDVGCGSGDFLAQQASGVRRAVGLDLSYPQVEVARRRLASRIAAGTAEVVRGDAQRLPWPDTSFTVVTCMASFEAFPHPAKALAEMHRVLRPGGRVVLNIGQRVPPGTRTHRVLGGRVWVWAEDDVRRLVEEAGFTDVAVRYASAWRGGRAAELLSRLVGGHQELRIVHGVKPLDTTPNQTRSAG